ncbi:MAG: hypothetical protein QM702_24005 [Rubrivivax sp.]
MQLNAKLEEATATVADSQRVQAEQFSRMLCRFALDDTASA